MHAVPHGPDATIQMPAQIPEDSVHIALATPEPSVPLLQRGHLHGMTGSVEAPAVSCTGVGKTLQDSALQDSVLETALSVALDVLPKLMVQGPGGCAEARPDSQQAAERGPCIRVRAHQWLV